MSQVLTVIGLMSGTSLDGLDICCARFEKTSDGYDYEIIATETIPYSKVWQKRLSEAYELPINQLGAIDKRFGEYLGQMTNKFILENSLTDKVDVIASHGQTIFHQPENGITVQIGDGRILTNNTGLNVINNFRIKDVELGGQGAPLVPVGDKLLFAHYDSCLNLGGIANISFDKKKKRVAFDVCPANLPLNKLTRKYFNVPFDRHGLLARGGRVNEPLLQQLDALEYYKTDPPKSLGYEWIDEYYYPIIEKFSNLKKEDLLRTIVEHETNQIAEILNDNKIKNCLLSGGGALNKFFVEILESKTKCEIIVPNDNIIEFKEALIFAFLGYLNMNNTVNTLASVTGAKSDSIGGIRHFTI